MQSDSGKAGLNPLMFHADRTVLANFESMGFEFATFRCCPTKLVQVPNPSSDLVHRTDSDFCFVVGDLITDYSFEHPSLRVRWASWFRRLLTTSNAETSSLTDRAAGMTKRFEGGSLNLLLQLCLIELCANGYIDHRASSNVKVNRLVN